MVAEVQQVGPNLQLVQTNGVKSSLDDGKQVSCFQGQGLQGSEIGDNLITSSNGEYNGAAIESNYMYVLNPQTGKLVNVMIPSIDAVPDISMPADNRVPETKDVKESKKVTVRTFEEKQSDCIKVGTGLGALFGGTMGVGIGAGISSWGIGLAGGVAGVAIGGVLLGAGFGWVLAKIAASIFEENSDKK